MKKILLPLLVLFLTVEVLHSQQNRFNVELDKFCKNAIKEFRTIPDDRKSILDEMAQQLSKKKYVVFTCRTNSRRTLMLQVWAQTSFYYYGLFGKYSFSIGDTVTEIYPGVASVLSESGFYCTNLVSAEPQGYAISINKDFPENMLSSKNAIGTFDATKGVLVNICFEDEKQASIAANKTSVSLPYQSPTLFEKTAQEKEKYAALNHQIAIEMLYLAARARDIIVENENARY